MSDSNKEYLGDGVYADLKDGQIILTTENGISETNRIVLEPEVYIRFMGWVGDLHDGRLRERSR